jgi:uncharacterized LabA/DUF88 family protein
MNTGKTIVCIDGPNLGATSKLLGANIDYKSLLITLKESYDVLRVYYYTATTNAEEYNSIRPLLDYLSYNGYTVKTKTVKVFTGPNGERKVKGNMDVEIAVDMMKFSSNVDNIILMTGDGDFRYLVEELQNRGVKVILVSTVRGKTGILADELRRQVDEFIDLAELVYIPEIMEQIL